MPVQGGKRTFGAVGTNGENGAESGTGSFSGVIQGKDKIVQEANI